MKMMTRTSNIALRLALVAAIGVLPAIPQEPAKPETKPKAEEEPEINFRQTLKLVLAPTTVTDKNGDVITGLTVADFKLYDNDKKQELGNDVSVHPISIVVAVQANNEVGEILPKIQRVGSVIGDLVVGGNGEAAVVAFDHRIRTIQDFTSDSGKISDAMKKIKPGSSTSAMIDAVGAGVNMLKKRPEDHRRIILLISETNDKGSEGRAREIMREAQLHNVVVYTVNISHVVAELTQKAIPPAPSPIPPEATVGRPGVAMNPTTISQNRDLGSFIPVFEDIFKAGKGVFISNPATVFTKFTGGKEYPFVKLEGLESDLVRLGQELHNQYLLSYSPNNLSEGGYHKIQVVVSRPNLEIRTRPGYWTAGEAQQ